MFFEFIFRIRKQHGFGAKVLFVLGGTDERCTEVHGLSPVYRRLLCREKGEIYVYLANFYADCPFKTMDRVLNEIPKDLPVLVDFHAEATSEKITMAYYLDGRVTAVVGTHTHVQTSDAMLLPKGTAYLTDLGMTGPYVSSIGRDLKPVTRKFVTGMPARFEVAEGPCVLEGAIVDFDAKTKKAASIETFRVREPLQQ